MEKNAVPTGDVIKDWDIREDEKIYPFTARRLRPLRWEMNCVCYLLDRAF